MGRRTPQPSSEPDIRVLHLLNAATGGAARSSLELVRQLTAMGLEGQAIVCHDMGTEADRATLTEAVDGRVLFTDLKWWNRKAATAKWKRPVVEFVHGLKTGFGISSSMKVAEFAGSQRSTLIHSNSFTIDDGCRASRWLGIPHVWHLRELIGPDSPFQFPLAGRALARFVSDNCDAVIANSRESARRLMKLAPTRPVFIIPNGIDTRDFSRGGGDRSRAEGSALVVGMVANLTSRMKNHELFLRAAARVPADTGAEFRIYGFGGHGTRRDPYVERLRTLACTEELKGRVRFEGYVADPAAIMKQLDVLVHPCPVESFGRAVLEAMAAGIPVVAIGSGGTADLVRDGDTGFLVSENDVDGMASRVERLLRSAAERREMGERARARAEGEFSIRAASARVLEVYRGVVGESDRPSGTMTPRAGSEVA